MRQRKLISFVCKGAIIICFISVMFSYFNNDFNRNRTFVLGHKLTEIQTESMLPVLQVGDMLLIQKTKFEDIEVGDIIAYEHKIDNKNLLIIHRVVAFTEDGLITKGDNNSSPDNWTVTEQDFVGKILFKN